MRTLRSKHDRNHLYIIADGKCRICGRNLKEDWQADHEIPYAICKTTELENMQATCKLCNLEKGDKMLRKHQKELQEIIRAIVVEHQKTGKLSKRKIVSQIFPGGGKSTHPIMAAKMLKDAGIIDKICWVVPRTSLKNQGAQEFLKQYLKDDFPHNLEVRETENVNDVNPTRGSDGYVTTYQALVSAKHHNANRDNCHEYEFSQHRYLLFLDECQHVVKDPSDAEGYGYYTAIKPLYEKAAFVICVSGTLFRNEKEQIAFVDHRSVVGDNGEPLKEPVVDIDYTYDDAIADKAIIPIYFDKGHAASVKYKKNGKEFNKAQLENNTDLSVALSTEYGNELLDEGIRIWQDYKQRTNPRAKLVIVGYDQAHCRAISTTLFGRGMSASTCLAISDEGSQAQHNIKRFRKDPRANILITCQMAYEGLDCREATHLIVLTRIRSLPWLIQMFTRVMRHDRDNDLAWHEQQAYAIVPNDPAMEDALKYIKAKPTTSISDQDPFEDFIQNLETQTEITWEATVIEDKSSKLGGVYQSNLDGEELSPDLMAKIKLYQGKYNLHQPEIDTYRMLRDAGVLVVLDQFESTNDILVSSSMAMTIREREKALRDDIEKLARRLDYKFGDDHGTWNKKVFNAFRRGRKEMTVEDLKECLQWLKREAVARAKELGIIKPKVKDVAGNYDPAIHDATPAFS